VVGPDGARTISLPARVWLAIGRDPTCEVVLDDARVSRRHAAITSGVDGAMQLEDLGSTNGIRVGARTIRAGERTPLASGESFQLGAFSIALVTGDHGGDSTSGPRAAIRVEDPTRAGVSPTVERIARSAVSVLVRGETGVGKGVLAETVHAVSGRAGPLLALNCAALGESLLESELFGHVRGAFTGAVRDKPGLLEVAAGGTVFLDEIGELPPAVQAKMLRALEEREVRRVGALEATRLDVRFITATHRDLAADIAAGRFRQDLYYRLNGITLAIPPLRERREAIAVLARSFLAPPLVLSAAALEHLRRYAWPGNVRELRAVVERAVLLCDGGEITPRHLILDDAARAPPPTASAAPPRLDDDEATERARIVDALATCQGNQTRAARLLGMSRAHFVTKLAIHRIPRPRKG
jgi:two-component system, NtrC family, response regulator AtoC